jgi:hypothetical protein
MHARRQCLEKLGLTSFMLPYAGTTAVNQRSPQFDTNEHESKNVGFIPFIDASCSYTWSMQSPFNRTH